VAVGAAAGVAAGEAGLARRHEHRGGTDRFPPSAYLRISAES